VWVRIDQDGEDDLNGEQLKAVRMAFTRVPGFVDSSFEDSYEEY
jgi:hypothetical protein